ncbi:hypothetical protein BDL97_17G088200 [Sphagnum fallax]|nr:hypothetical protein BDL97_17G088200 [Sphagnum fallax]
MQLSFRVLKRTELVDTPRCAMLLSVSLRALNRRLIQKIQFLALKSRLVKRRRTHQATASAAIVSRVEEEGSRQGTTSDDIIASRISGAEEAAREVPVYSVEQADGDGPTCDEGNEIFFSGAEEIGRCPLLVSQSTFSDVVEHAAPPESPISGVEEAAGERDGSMQYSSRDEKVARAARKRFRSHVKVKAGRCTFQCVKIQENGSGTSLDYESPVRSLKDLEKAVEECNSIYRSSKPGTFEIVHTEFDMNVPELEVTEKLIELLMTIDKDRVHLPLDDDSRFLTLHGIMTSQIL